MSPSGLITAILFVAGEPVEKSDLCAWTGLAEDELERAVQEILQMAEQGAGLTLIHIGTRIQLVTSPRYAGRLKDIFQPKSTATLSSALLETLTIIAYQQPVTRAEVEQIRGVRSVYPIATLVDRGLIRKVGSKPVLGTPALYGTTDEFLRQFGLSSLSDLPALQPEDEARRPEREDGAGPESRKDDLDETGGAGAEQGAAEFPAADPVGDRPRDGGRTSGGPAVAESTSSNLATDGQGPAQAPEAPGSAPVEGGSGAGAAPDVDSFGPAWPQAGGDSHT